MKVMRTKVTFKGDLSRISSVSCGKIVLIQERQQERKFDMKSREIVSILLLASALGVPCRVKAQSEDGDPSLGDLARSLRQSKQAQAAPEINNDNFSQMMQAADQQKPWDSLKYSISSGANSFQVSAPDVTCNLSFNSRATALLTDPFATRSLPDSEIAKLNGPARIEGDTFEISMYNGSDWTLREVTVALTIVHPSASTASYRAGKLIPASITSSDTDQKLSDTTLLFHMKGAAASSSTTVFQQALQSQLAPGDDWHWAIIDAKGMPPKADPVLPPTMDPFLPPAQIQLAPQSQTSPQVQPPPQPIQSTQAGSTDSGKPSSAQVPR